MSMSCQKRAKNSGGRVTTLPSIRLSAASESDAVPERNKAAHECLCRGFMTKNVEINYYIVNIFIKKTMNLKRF